MPATSSGRIVKNRKAKSGTAHSKNHRWESFTTKISKLSSLDPIRRVRRHGIDTDDLAATTSYFKAGVEKWQELNMSEAFVNFTQEVLPLCDSLPQILHFEDRIMALLVTYIEKRERESLEPLMELMTDFAHDLGTRFEKHYAKALELITSIAGIPQDVEVIEWSFTSLAFLFKYLSKLLVPDLRPTYDLMAPLMGKHRQQPHIARFAAEAMSFLVKKAGAPANRESALPMIIKHAKSDLKSVAETRQFILYYHGLMTLFAEAMKGNGLTVHTSGPAIFKALILGLEEDIGTEKGSCWPDVICGVLTSIVHHTSSETLKDIVEVIVEQSNVTVADFTQSRSKFDLLRLTLSARLIGIVAGVRKGSRVQNWTVLHESLSDILNAVSKNGAAIATLGKGLDLWNSLVLTVSIVLQYAPMDSVIPFISTYMDSLIKDPLVKWFLTFCFYLSEAEPERFRSIALPYFRRFVVAHWSDKDNEDTLLILLPKMVSSGVLPSRYSKDGFCLPQSWQDHMVSKFERLELKPFPEQASPAVYDRSPMTWHDRCLPKYNALLEVLECTIVHPSTNARIAEILLRKLKLALRPSQALAPEEAHFIVGRGFSAYSRMIMGASDVDRALEPLLRAAAPRYARLPNFLEALLAYEASLKASPPPSSTKSIKVAPLKDSGEEDDLLGRSLVSNLATDSHELRLLSLQLLNHLHGEHGQASDILSIMLTIEQSPLNLQSARSTSMHIRNLATKFPHQPLDSILRQAIPSFCFGMLTVKLAQIWEDASGALKQISETKDGEEAVAQLAFSWLETPSVAWDSTSRNVEQARNSGLTDFECSNLIKLRELAETADTEVVNAQGTMLRKFEEAQSLVASPPPSARMQAIRVLTAAPYIAQKRSRQFIPMFLSWASKNEEEIEQPGNGFEQKLSDWTRKDQKAQLDLVSLFTNPKVLYRSEDVYSSLLSLLENGDIEIQRSALKAIFTWKDSSIRPYEENLLNLLDEARFKDEITILLQGQTLVQPDHRLDLMPVLLRLLYGRTISRKGAASGRQGMEAKRLTVLRNLSVEDVGGFLDIALSELAGIALFEGGRLLESTVEKEILTVRKQVGFTNMIEGVLKELGTKVEPFSEKLLEPILYCLIYASRQLQMEVDSDENDATHTSQTSLLRVVRQTGLKCLNLLFKNTTEFDWSLYLGAINEEVVRPRLEKLPIETAQGISGILQLFLTWSSSPQTVLYLGKDGQVLRTVAECLSPPKTKDEVKLFVLSIINNIIKFANTEAFGPLALQVKTGLLGENMDHFLIQIGSVLRGQQDLSKDLLEACVQTVSDLAPHVTTSTQGQNLVNVSVFLLDQPSRRVSPKTKGGLLLVLEHFVPLYNLQNDVILKDKVYNTITSLFGFFKDKISREVLSRVLLVYSENDPVIGDVAQLCMDLNSFAEGRLDEPDYDRRLKAFTTMNRQREVPFTARQWTPLLYNMLYYIRHDEEFGILSSNSHDGICRFLDTAKESLTEPQVFRSMISTILMPALYSGAREPSEVIRREYIKVMAHLVRSFPDWSDVNDMHELLAGDNEIEASFFNNILSAGKGRQSSALGQLSAAAEKGQLNGKNVSHFFIPLIEHFIFDRADGNDAHNLAAEATTAVGVLSRSLEWPQYRAMLRRFIGYVQSKPELGKQIIRLLGRVVDALSLAAVEEKSSDMAAPRTRSTLAVTMPNQLKLADDLKSNILPPLTAYLHDKDESTVSLRVPVAVISVGLLKLLPEEQLMALLPPVLTDICQILRSKAQESRDMARDTLTKICVLLGPSCFGFVLKELKSALARGSQRHVLSYTMHSILVSVTPEYAPGDLDYCLKPIVDVIIDDIFGDPGKEKDAEEYASKMKEVKSSKSHDSMELISTTATLSNLTVLLHPIQLLLNEKLNLRMVRKIDELLHRISSGLLKNADVQSRDSLQFCYEVIRDTQNSARPETKAQEDKRTKKYLAQRGAKKPASGGSMTVYKYKLVGFAFDVMRAVLKRHENLRTSKNLAHFIPIIGDAIVEAEEEVRVAAFRLLTVIVKVSLKPEIDRTNLYRVAMAEASASIIASSSTASDIAQAALKLISAVLRDAGNEDRAPIPHQDKSIDKVLSKLKEDMTEPERRTPIFTFLRAVMDRKIETAGVYETLEYAREVMVTNDDDETRNLARGAYCQFLREYIQRKDLVRLWKKQRDFIRDNLGYKREDGRLTILAVIIFLVSKSESAKTEASYDYVQDVAETFFKPLVSVLVGDESDKCKTLAGGVLKEIFSKARPAQLQTFLAFLRSCTENENPDIKRIGLQTYLLYFEGREEAQEDIPMLQECILEILEDSDSGWPLVSCALKLMEALCQKVPGSMLSSNSNKLWKTIRPRLNDRDDPHRWVRKSAATLASMYFADFARTSTDFKLPLAGSRGLILSAEDTIELTRSIAGMFKIPDLETDLANVILNNLLFLGRVAGSNNLKWRPIQQADAESGDEEDEEDEEDRTALDYLFGRLSYILRREVSPPRAPGLVPKTAALRLLQNLTQILPTSTVLASVQTILLPLNNLTDAAIPAPYSIDPDFKETYEALKSTSTEIMEYLQKQIGVEGYTKAILEVRRGVRDRREKRSSKRKIEAVAAPEKYGRDKKKKVERKKEKRKERGQEHRDARHAF